MESSEEVVDQAITEVITVTVVITRIMIITVITVITVTIERRTTDFRKTFRFLNICELVSISFVSIPVVDNADTHPIGES